MDPRPARPPIDLTAAAAPTATPGRLGLVKNPADFRQLAIVATYLGLLASMYSVPACRNVGFFAAACYFSFLNTVVIHNHLHQGIFHSRRLNMIFRCVLSFGALYPASANIPSHNLVHHHFDDEGQPDWAAPEQVDFGWNLLNLLHFPNVAGPSTFAGVQRWAALASKDAFRRQYNYENLTALGLTLLLFAHDPFTTIFFIFLPQVYGARSILRINLIQHDACDTDSEWSHSRNFVGRAFNWIMCNNGYHTIHHNRAGLHWSVLPAAHRAEVVPRAHPELNEPSMVRYLVRTYLFRTTRPPPRRLAGALGPAAELASREVRRAEAAVACE